jgi:hypothetical protein
MPFFLGQTANHAFLAAKMTGPPIRLGRIPKGLCLGGGVKQEVGDRLTANSFKISSHFLDFRDILPQKKVNLRDPKSGLWLAGTGKLCPGFSSRSF